MWLYLSVCASCIEKRKVNITVRSCTYAAEWKIAKARSQTSRERGTLRKSLQDPQERERERPQSRKRIAFWCARIIKDARQPISISLFADTCVMAHLRARWNFPRRVYRRRSRSYRAHSTCAVHYFALAFFLFYRDVTDLWGLSFLCRGLYFWKNNDDGVFGG